MKKIIILLLLALVIFAGCGEPGDTTTADDTTTDGTTKVVISGYGITDVKLDNASVEITDLDGNVVAEGTTDEKGYFSIEIKDDLSKANIATMRVPCIVKVYKGGSTVSRIVPSDSEHEELQVNPVTTGVVEYCNTTTEPDKTWTTTTDSLPDECKSLINPVQNEGLVVASINVAKELGVDNIINELKDNGKIDGSDSTNNDPIIGTALLKVLNDAHKNVFSGIWKNENYNDCFGTPPAKIWYYETDEGLDGYTYYQDTDTNPMQTKRSMTYEGLDSKQNMKFKINYIGSYFYFIFRYGENSLGRTGKWQEYDGVLIESETDDAYPTDFSGDYGVDSVGGIFYYDSALPEITTPVTSVDISKSTLSIDLGSTTTATLTATVNPASATNRAVMWSSSDPEVAEVSTTGEVTAKKAGSTTITVTTMDKEKTATCEVTVTGETILTDVFNTSKITVTTEKYIKGETGCINTSKIDGFTAGNFFVVAFEEGVTTSFENVSGFSAISAEGSFEPLSSPTDQSDTPPVKVFDSGNYDLAVFNSEYLICSDVVTYTVE